jgi:hypothetical protein
MTDKTCENCGYVMEEGDVSGYIYIGFDRYFEFHEPLEEFEETSVHDTFICENCVIRECHDIDVPEGVDNPKEWLLNLIRSEDER